MIYETYAQLIALKSKELLPWDLSNVIFMSLLECYYSFYVPANGHMKTSAYQFGGGTYDIAFEDNEFNVVIDNNLDAIIAYVYSYAKNSKCCGMIVVNKETTDAIIHDLAYTTFCSKKNLPTGGGTLLLRFLIYFIKKYLKKTYDINRILLTDNSYKFCSECKKNISLATNYVLLSGDTWYSAVTAFLGIEYGKFGFRPFDKKHNVPDEKQSKKYKMNQEIMNNTLVKDVDLLNIIIKCTKDKESIKMWKQHLISHSNDLLKNYLKKYIKNNCCLLDYISEYLYEKLHSTDFYAQPFFLDI